MCANYTTMYIYSFFTLCFEYCVAHKHTKLWSYTHLKRLNRLALESDLLSAS